MAKYRFITLEAASDWGDSGTKTIDLDYKTPITQINIRGVFLAGTTTWANSPASNFTKIEIVDGSNVLWSATGKAAQGHWMESMGRDPPGYQHLRNAKSVGIDIPIMFGRFFGDRKYAFDPTKYKNPQLKITWNEDTHCTTTTSWSGSVKAILFDDNPPNPIGFLNLYEVEAYNPSASTRHDVQIPTDQIVRTIYVQCRESQQSLSASMGNVKLTEDGDTKVVYNDTMSEIQRILNENRRVFHEDFRMHVATSGDTYFSAIGNIIGGVTGSYDSASASGFASHMGGSFKIRAENTSQYYTAHITGYNPQAMFKLDICEYDDDTSWYDPTRLGTWELQLTAGAQADTALTYRVYVERLTRY